MGESRIEENSAGTSEMARLVGCKGYDCELPPRMDSQQACLILTS